MSTKGMTRLVLVAVATLLLGAGSPFVLAHGGGGFGMGPGMMGPGMMGGSGMMDMMGPGMMGPGMMGGSGMMGGMGPGMMGGGGMMGGPGMMMAPGGMGTVGPLGMLDLSADQRSKIGQIQSDLRKQQWGTMGQVMDEQEKLQELLAAETPGPKKVGAAHAKIADLQRQMIEARIEAHNRVQAVLTKEQREQLRQFRQGRSGSGPAGPGMGPGMGGGMRGG